MVQPAINDVGHPAVLRVVSSTAHYVYVGNLGVISRSAEVVKRTLAWKMIVGGVGSLLHKSEEGVIVQSLGVRLDGGAHRSGVTPSRFWIVRQAVGGLLAQKRCHGKALAKMLGPIAFCWLGCRPALSALHVCYRYGQAFYEKPGVLWEEA